MIIRQETPNDWLDRTEKEASEHLRLAKIHWIEFCKDANAINESDLYKMKAQTWHDYVRLTWDIDSSRIRQFNGALPYAEILQVALPELAIPEATIRKMKAAGISPDDPNMPKIYKNVVEIASEQGVTIQQSFFEHGKQVYEEAERTGGYIDIGEDEVVPIDWEGSTKLAMLRSIQEAKHRNTQRLLQNKEAYTVTAKRIGDNQYLLTTDEALPEQFQFKLWKDKGVTESEPIHPVQAALDAVDKLEGRK